MPGTTPVYGFPYPEPTDLVADYPALGQDLAEDIEAVLPTLGGLTLISPTSITNTGGTASTSAGKTTFSGVTNISLNGVFSANYANYLVWGFFTGSATARMNMRLRVSGADNTTSNYYSNYINNVTWASSSFSGGGVAAGSAFSLGCVVNATARSMMVLHVDGPFASSVTLYKENSTDTRTTDGTTMNGGGLHNVASSFTAITFYAATGTITGDLRVYGLRGA